MKISLEIFNILLLLLPGLVASQIFYTIVKVKDVSGGKRIYDSIIFSFIILLFTSLFFSWEPTLQVTKISGYFNYHISENNSLIIFNIVLMIVIPTTVAAIYHLDLFHKGLRALNLTTKTSRNNTWSETFITEDRHIIIYLTDERRIRGYPEKFSDDPEEGFIYIRNPAWINDDKKTDNDPDYIELNTHGMLIQRDKIDMIEFTLNKDETV